LTATCAITFVDSRFLASSVRTGGGGRRRPNLKDTQARGVCGFSLHSPEVKDVDEDDPPSDGSDVSFGFLFFSSPVACSFCFMLPCIAAASPVPGEIARRFLSPVAPLGRTMRSRGVAGVAPRSVPPKFKPPSGPSGQEKHAFSTEGRCEGQPAHGTNTQRNATDVNRPRRRSLCGAPFPVAPLFSPSSRPTPSQPLTHFVLA